MQLSTIAIATRAMTGKRTRHSCAPTTAGVVLICGGLDASGAALASAELYSVGSGLCVATGMMTIPRYDAAAVLLTDGRVLVSGGRTTGGAIVASAEYFYPLRGTFIAAIAGLSSARAGHSALLTVNGLVLVAGGDDSGAGDAALQLTELYVPAAPAEMAGVSPY